VASSGPKFSVPLWPSKAIRASTCELSRSPGDYPTLPRELADGSPSTTLFLLSRLVAIDSKGSVLHVDGVYRKRDILQQNTAVLPERMVDPGRGGLSSP